MMTAVILHGMRLKDMYFDPSTASPSNYHWIPWLQKSLLLSGVIAQTPEMPRPYEPDYRAWKETLERFFIGPDTTLDPAHQRTGSFFDFTINPDLASRSGEVVIFNSDNDDDTIQQSVRRIRAALPTATYREFHLGHFSHWDMPSDVPGVAR